MSYNLVGWENRPSTKTPVGQSNLNHMDMGIKDAHDILDTKANAIINSASGETISIFDAANQQPKNIIPFGKSWQNTVGGNQLFEKIRSEGLGATLSTDSLTATCKPQTAETYSNQFMLYHDPKTLIIGTTYYITAKIKLDSGTLTWINSIKWMDEAGNSVGTAVEITRPKTMSSEYQFYKFSFTPTADVVARRIYVQGYQANNAVCTITDIMITTNADAEWEPYTGGIPSPNPNYPQDIHSNGESGSIEYSLYGGNLLKYPFHESTRTVNGITFTDKGNGIIGISGTSTGTVYFTFYPNTDGQRFKLPKGTYTLTRNTSNNNININGRVRYSDGTTVADIYMPRTKTTITFTANENVEIFMHIVVPSGVTFNEDIVVMLNKGTTALPWEEYKAPQPLILQTPNGFGGIEMGSNIFTVIKNSPIHMQGVYLDSATNHYYIGNLIDLDRGKNIKFIGEYIFTGDEIFNKRGVNIADVYQVYLKQFKFGDSAINVPTLCTHYRYSTDNVLNTCYIMAHGYVSFGFAEYGTTTETDIKAKFKELYDAGTPVKLYGVLATPIETDLTEEEIAQYKALMMNYPNTTIINDANAYTEVEYVVDTKCYIDNKFKELEIALANTNAQLL